MSLRRALAAGALGAALSIAGSAQAGLYWGAGVRSKTVTVCFVGDAVTLRSSRVDQVLRYLREFEYAANVRFPATGVACAAPTTVSGGKEAYDGDVRVLLPFTNAPWTGAVPGLGCSMFRDSAGNYNGGNDGWGSWSNAPNDLANNRPCLYNLKLGDDGASGVPYLNHTLHEFGHALGLAHEHLRNDVDRNWVLSYFKTMKDTDDAHAGNIYAAGYRNLDEIAGATVAQLQGIVGYGAAADAAKLKMDATFLTHIAGVTVAIAQAIYAAGFTTAAAVANAQVSDLQAIPGFSAAADAQKLNADASVAPLREVYGDGATGGHITAYDAASVMHYKFIIAGMNGNYDYTGLSALDRLSAHILYPEDVQVAEYVGTTVIDTATRVVLASAWGVRSADLAFVASDFEWRVDGAVRSTSASLDVQLPAGDHGLQFSHRDFLGRTYTYAGVIHVLSPADFAMQAAVLAAQVPLL